MKPLITAFFLLGEASLEAGSPLAVLWAGPGIVIASLMIAWGAEATQFFIAQGIALAILALLQTLPEFAVEAVLAWHQEVRYLLANLTGALQLLTGIGWPLIYFAAARAYRREYGKPMRCIRLENEHAVQILGLLAGLAWEFVVWWKDSLTVYDAVILIAVYVGYLWIMRRLPPQESETLDEIARIPRAIVTASKPARLAAICGLFTVGITLVFAVAGPFLAGLFGLSLLVGIPQFTFIQWVAPMVSEAPEGVSAYYWARDHRRASIALMNLVSSNINQWTLLAAMLPVVLSVSVRAIVPIPLDPLQSRELALTLSQSLLGALFLINMELAWWEAAGLFLLFLIQFAGAGGEGSPRIHLLVTWAYLAWCAFEVIRVITGNRKATALRHFRNVLAPPDVRR
jgi:cation:H+ antiporter